MAMTDLLFATEHGNDHRNSMRRERQALATDLAQLLR